MVGVSEQKLYQSQFWKKKNAQNMISCNVSRRTDEEITEVDLLQSSSMKGS